MEVNYIHKAMANKGDWIRCSAIRLKNGKLQIKNPGFWGSLFQQKGGGASKSFNKKYAKGYFEKEAPPLSKSKGKTIPDRDFNDVVQALVSQGAGKSRAKMAVQAAAARGARGFEGLFRQALKEL